MLALCPLLAAGAGAEPRMNPDNNHWYNIVEVDCASANYWESAQAVASLTGGNLAAINDAKEQIWVYDNFVSGTFRNYWIGINDAQVEETLGWINGDATAYTNWYGSWDNTATRDYGYMRQSDGMWDLTGKNAYKLGIAEWPAGTATPEPVSSSLFASGGVLLLRRVFSKKRIGKGIKKGLE